MVRALDADGCQLRATRRDSRVPWAHHQRRRVFRPGLARCAVRPVPVVRRPTSSRTGAQGRALPPRSPAAEPAGGSVRGHRGRCHRPWLRPNPSTGEGPFPTAVLLGGLESTKEESYQFEQQLLARGIATVTFDGPGQGEMFPEVPLRGDYERYTSAVVDYAEKLPEIDSSRIAVVGRSLGGHYALRSAALDDRFIACISWGGFADMDSYDEETPMTKESWKYVTASSTDEESRERVMTLMDVRSELHKLRVPTYIQHGMHDEVPVSEVEVVKQLAVDAP
ncbi:alpha/beta hydrolase family protein [Klenkia terrae]|uniref:alpha/beta hydrolase family protein n=1 Tax=Klenkia terrae TaxID=1052259 RepID=UPI00360B7B58